MAGTTDGLSSDSAAVGLQHPLHNGIDAIGGAAGSASAAIGGAVARLWMPERPVAFTTGPRVGVAGVAGTDVFPWRFWMPGDDTVSPFRPGRGAGPGASASRTAPL